LVYALLKLWRTGLVFFAAAGDGCDHVMLTSAATPTPPSANSNHSTAVSLNLLHSAFIESPPTTTQHQQQHQHQRSRAPSVVTAKRTSQYQWRIPTKKSLGV